MSNSEAEAKTGFWTVIAFLMRAECVFDAAILRTPTGDDRNKYTALNIERMMLIQGSRDIILFAQELHAILDKLVTCVNALSEISADDTRLGDAIDARDDAIEQLVELFKK